MKPRGLQIEGVIHLNWIPLSHMAICPVTTRLGIGQLRLEIPYAFSNAFAACGLLRSRSPGAVGPGGGLPSPTCELHLPFCISQQCVLRVVDRPR